MNLFEGVLEAENSVTALLKNLMQSQEVRTNILSQFVEHECAATVDWYDIDSQRRHEEGQPDLVVATRSFRLDIEVKVRNTQLTQNQPEGYASHLSRQRIPVYLGFIVPPNYAYFDKLKDHIAHAERLYPSVKVLVRTWDTILSDLEDIEDTEHAGVLTEFRNYLRSRFVLEPMMFDKGEIDLLNARTTAEVLHKLLLKVDQTEDAIKARCPAGWAVSKPDRWNHGFQVASGGQSVWFGVWYSAWEKLGTPLSIAIGEEDRQLCQRLSELHPQEVKRFRDTDPDHTPYVAWPVPTTYLATQPEEAFVEAVLEELKGVLGS